MEAYLQDRDEPGFYQLLAAQSSLPSSNLHRARHNRSDCQTSLMLSGNDHTLVSGTPSQELAGLTRGTSEATPESIPASFGERKLNQTMRLLESGMGGTLNVPRMPAQQLECPFNLAFFCFLTFSNLEDWVQHSLTHFGSCAPLSSNTCCFCDAVFHHSSGQQSWKERMIHIYLHHQLGYRLAHARPDFELFTYLWNNRRISDAEYRELKGNSESRSRAVAAHPVPFTGPNKHGNAYSETSRNTRRHNARGESRRR